MKQDGRLIERLESLNTKGCLWMYILKILDKRSTHAYNLRKDIEADFGFRPGSVTAYRVLYHLMSKGLVSKKITGRRKVYTITSLGKKELRKAVIFYRKQASRLAV
jgi:DNA-binding PadR family transcriptional regulator